MSRATLAALVLLAWLPLGCGGDTKTAVVKAPPVAIVTTTARDLEDRIQVSGELAARNQTTIAAEVPGRITRIHVEEGDAIENGALLIEIDPERRQLELASARARASQARAELAKERREAKRVRTLHESAIASKSRLDEADTALAMAAAGAESARAQVAVAERAVSDANVTAPFAGLLARRLVNVGEFVQPATPLVELVSLDPLDVLFRVAEVDSGRVHVGQQVSVHVAPFPDREFTATVDVVSPTIDPETRTLRVRATLPNAEGVLRPGLFARAGLGVATRSKVVVVPEEAVLQRAGGPIVFALVGEDRVERREVTTGGFYPAGLEVTSGVDAGERIIVRGHADLVDGAVVRVTEVDGSRPDQGVAAAADDALAKGAL
jgi:membrane fusion protein (multidrug efflux system)